MTMFWKIVGYTIAGTILGPLAIAALMAGDYECEEI